LISKALRKSWDDPAKDTKEQSAPKSFTKKDNTVHVCILFLPLLKVWIIQSPAECPSLAHINQPLHHRSVTVIMQITRLEQ
jgi:hypothetical protein